MSALPSTHVGSKLDSVRLNSLPPISPETRHRESLFSYLQRLALSHYITPNVLVRDILANDAGTRPLLQPTESEIEHLRKTDGIGWSWGWGWFHNDGKSMLGARSAASSWSNALASVTGQDSLHSCNLTGFAHHLADTNLIKPYERHCPHCLKEDRAADRPTYERLLWRIGAVECCPEHKVRLVRHRCGSEKKLAPRERVKLPGVCTECGAKGMHCTVHKAEPATPVELWRAEQVALMFDDTNALKLSDVAAMKAAVAQHAQLTGGVVKLASRMGAPKSLLSRWLNQAEAKLSLEHLLDLCASDCLSLNQLLRGHLVAELNPCQIRTPQRAKIVKKPVDHQKVRELMQAGLAAGKSLAKIAREACVDRGTLAVHQDLHKLVKQASLTKEQQRNANRRNNAAAETEATVRKLIKNSMAITLRNASKETGRAWRPAELPSQMLSMVAADLAERQAKNYQLSSKTKDLARELAKKIRRELEELPQPSLF